MDVGDDPYALLGVDQKAGYDVLKKAYRKLALKQHPDKGGDPVLFAKIANAYEILSDPPQRQNYDLQQNHGSKGYDPQAPTFTSVSEDYDPSKEDHSSPRRSTSSSPRDTRTSKTSSSPEWTTTYTTTRSTPSSFSSHRFKDPMEMFRQQFPDMPSGATMTKTSTSVSPEGHTTTTTTMTTPDGRTMTMTSTSTSTGTSTTSPPTTKPKKKKKKDKKSKKSTSPSRQSTSGMMDIPAFPKTTKSRTSKTTRISLPTQQQQTQLPQRLGRMSLREDNGFGSSLNNDDDDDGVMGMSQSSRTVTHPNGQREVITETVITRADGSTETRRQSRMIR